MQLKIKIPDKNMPLTDNDWNAFLRELKSGQCCLLLGPEVRCFNDGDDPAKASSVMEKFSAFIAGLLDKLNIPYKKEENDFYYLAGKYINTQYPGQESKFETEIREFKDLLTQMQSPFFQKIARLPFNSIVNLVPDNFLATQLNQIGYEFAEDYYDYTSLRNIDITDEMQLVFNLFGSFENPDSVAVTEQQRLSLLKNLVSGSPKINDKIAKRFSDKKKSFLFLGFNFNNWHFRLVMDALKIPKPNNFSFSTQTGAAQSIGFLNQEFYSEKLGLRLIDQTTEEYINELSERYQKQFGNFDRKLKVLLDYNDADKLQFTEFSTALEISGMSNRIDLWHKDKLAGGDSLTEISNQMKEAEIYIPFLSNSFLKDEPSKSRVTGALNDKTKRVIPVYTSFCAFEKILPVKNALIVLPRNNVPLSSKTGAELSQVCQEAVRIINCVVR
jgi:hypothetical protein